MRLRWWKTWEEKRAEDEKWHLETFGISSNEFSRLASYNGRVQEGVVHTPEYVKEMKKLQKRYNDKVRSELNL